MIRRDIFKTALAAFSGTTISEVSKDSRVLVFNVPIDAVVDEAFGDTIRKCLKKAGLDHVEVLLAKGFESVTVINKKES